MSQSSEGKRFWVTTFRPLKISCWVAGMLGSRRSPSSTVTKALSSTPAVSAPPRGRWYLKERPNSVRPDASSAEATVSPGWPVCSSPSTVKRIVRVRSMRPPAAVRRGLMRPSPGYLAGGGVRTCGGCLRGRRRRTRSCGSACCAPPPDAPGSRRNAARSHASRRPGWRGRRHKRFTPPGRSRRGRDGCGCRRPDRRIRRRRADRNRDR